ncbi:hypothetical protein QSV08_16930 [Maribacter sp. BPC-D8]|uniref:hypothetical protein n=1 Tax=Maribacter sp. BPC-D8 TaxID=3053613 RepID=UPI002B46232F|nr:hypothetical protein [Maribacter sp. BPC-D8]WRI28892.1 hypothetical protein QSV08_16930 [Maribacter sp. BPC-D8]
MKKIIFTYLSLIFLFGCSSNDTEEQLNLISIQIDLDQVEEYSDDYEYTDFMVKVYDTKEDYFNEVNAVFSGNIDATGKISISENLEEKSYYVDIYTEDKVLSNWEVIDLDVDASNIIKFSPANTNESYSTVYMTDHRKFVGNWSFLSYEQINNDNEERTDKVFLSINKEYTATSYETYDGVAYQLHFKLLGNGYLELVTIQPSSDNYPVYETNSEDIVVQIEQDGLLYFTNYSGDKAVYVSN